MAQPSHQSARLAWLGEQARHDQRASSWVSGATAADTTWRRPFADLEAIRHGAFDSVARSCRATWPS